MTMLVRQAGAGGGYRVPYSVLMDGAAHYGARTPSGAASSRRKGFISFPFRIASRLGDVDPAPYLYEGYVDVNNRTAISLSGDKLTIAHITGGVVYGYQSPALSRDVLKFGLPYIEWDTTQATAAQRMRLWMSGVEIPLGTVGSGAIPQNTDLFINHSVLQLLGRYGGALGYHFSGEFSEIIIGDGVTYGGPERIGRFNPATGQWELRNYTGAYGNNGGRWGWRDATNITTLGYDESGNGQHWTLNGMAPSDRLTDSPTNTFAIWSALRGNASIHEGGLLMAAPANTQMWRPATIPCLVKAHAEFVCGDASGGNTNWVGIIDADGVFTHAYSSDGNYFNGSTWEAYGAAYGNGDRITVEFDPFSRALQFKKNGTPQGSKTAAAGHTYVLAATAYFAAGQSGWLANFGQRPFLDAPSTGYEALRANALPSPAYRNPAIALASKSDLGSAIQSGLAALRAGWSGWIEEFKNRSASESWKLRYSDDPSNMLGTDSGFSTGKVAFTAPVAGDSYLGAATRVGVAFGVFTAEVAHVMGAPTNVAHGLGAARKVVDVRRTDADSRWFYLHPDLTAGKLLYLDGTEIETADASVTVDATNVMLAAALPSGNYRVTVRAEIPGLRIFGRYTPNGSIDGPVPWCGFKPRSVKIKRFNGAASWWRFDIARDGFNAIDLGLTIETPNVEAAGGATSIYLDFIAGGFKLRSNHNNVNAADGQYIFEAEAEAAFKYANAA